MTSLFASRCVCDWDQHLRLIHACGCGTQVKARDSHPLLANELPVESPEITYWTMPSQGPLCPPASQSQKTKNNDNSNVNYAVSTKHVTIAWSSIVFRATSADLFRIFIAFPFLDVFDVFFNWNVRIPNITIRISSSADWWHTVRGCAVCLPCTPIRWRLGPSVQSYRSVSLIYALSLTSPLTTRDHRRRRWQNVSSCRLTSRHFRSRVVDFHTFPLLDEPRRENYRLSAIDSSSALAQNAMSSCDGGASLRRAFQKVTSSSAMAERRASSSGDFKGASHFEAKF